MNHRKRALRVLARSPVAALFLMSLDVRESTDCTIPTVAVDKDGVFYVNSNWAAIVPDQTYVAVLSDVFGQWDAVRRKAA